MSQRINSQVVFRNDSLVIGNKVIPIDGPTEDHLLELEEFISKYEVDVSTGLNKQQVLTKRAKDGLNQLTPGKETPLWIQFIYELFKGFGLLIWLTCILCFISWQPLGDPPNVYNLALAIILAFLGFFQAFFNFMQHRNSSNIIAKFQKITPKRCNVLRESTWQEIDAAQVVVGDVIKMVAGEQFPADMRIIECRQAKNEKSSLTGESKPIALSTTPTDKNMLETKNLAFFGTYLLEGTCTGIVMNIGDKTVMGRIANLTATSKQPLTSLQKEINYFVVLVSFLSLVLILILLIAWLAWLRNAYPDFINTPNMIVVLLGVVVAFIPEGLPISVTMTLTLVAKRMFKNKLMVKRLAIIETLGSSTVIASDKTGTITQNQMSLSHIWFPQDPKDFKPELDYINLMNGEASSFHEQTLNVLHLATLCNNAEQSVGSDPSNKDDIKFVGSSTDVGLLRSASKLLDIKKIRKTLPVVAELPFNSRYKFQVTIHKTDDLTDFIGKKRWDDVLGTPNPGYIKILKGAPEVIIPHCNRVLLSNKVMDNSQDWTQMALGAAEKLASKGERVIGFAFEFLPQREALGTTELDENTPYLKNFAFAGFASLIDPPKEGVREAVNECHRAGIKVIMVTGDHPTTAIAIAKMVNIIEKEEVTLYNPESTVVGKEVALQLGAAKKKVTKYKKFKEFLQSIQKNFVTNIHERSKLPPIDAAIAIVGKDISSLNEQTWRFILTHKQIVFARTTPDQKLKIVQELQKLGEVVAVTGDGVNDAPALKCSDVGVAMGSGSDVSKEAANVICLNDSFGSIVKGIKEGRLLYENLQKVIAYLLPAGCFSEIQPIFANVFIGMPAPITSFQMIIICVGSDMLGSLGLVHEPPESGLMEKPPRDPKRDRMIGAKLLNHTFLQVGVLQSIIAYFMYFYTFHYYGIPPSGTLLAFSNWGTDGYLNTTADQQNFALGKAQTAYYVALVMTQLSNLLCARTRRTSLFTTKFRKSLIFYMLGEVAIVCFVCYVPFMNTYLTTVPADWYHFIFPLFMGLFILMVEETRKLLVRRNPKGFLAKMAW